MSEAALQAEIVRLNKVVKALIDRAELNESTQGSGFDLFHTAALLEEQVRRRTEELEAALKEKRFVTNELRESEMKFRALAEQSLVGLTLFDGVHFTYANPRLADMLGYSIDELMHMGALDITPSEDIHKIQKIIEKGLAGKFAPGSFIANAVRKDGSIMSAEIAGQVVEIGGRTMLLSVWTDVTERLRIEREVEELNNKLRDQSIRDPLTGLFNRRYLEETLERELTVAQRQGGKVSLIMGDIDLFKAVNDTYGHQAGDEVLRQFSDLLQKNSRASDVCCRYGGEEFMLVLPNADMETARQRAEGMRLAVAGATIRHGEISIRITSSFGVATYPLHGNDVDSLVSAVDAALYEAKSSGRNQVKCASPR